jgi:pSer/pThr/pTyr-binding forkhead associated (FHA) protein
MPPNTPAMEYELEMDRIQLGRSESCEIVVPTSQVSSAHCELIREEGGYRLIDRDSTNGTRVNGKRVYDILLKDNDELLIGNVVAAIFSIKADEDSADAVRVTEAKNPNVKGGTSATVPAVRPGDPSSPIKPPSSPEVSPARPAIKIAKPMPPGARD